MACREHLTVIFLFIGVQAYLLIGGAIFYAMEYPHEKENAQIAVSNVMDFLATHTCVNASELVTFLQSIKYLTDTGIVIANTTEPTLWTFQSSCSFAGTLITTIGYGSQTPQTLTSQIVCIFYGMFGIPLCLVFLAKVGNGIAKINNGVVDKLVKCPKEDKKRTILTIGILLIIGSILLIFIPCIGISYIEGWPYTTSLYFAMVTLSTVGFGDYVLAESVTGLASGLYRIAIGLWIVIGLAWFSSIISSIQERMTKDVNMIAAINEPKTEEKPTVDTGEETGISNESSLSSD